MLDNRVDRSRPLAATARYGSPSMLADVRRGLIDRGANGQRELPPKYLYDHRGSELFDQITRLPEYYLTRTEQALLGRWMPHWMATVGARALVELGPGSADKTRTILDAMQRVTQDLVYVPVDVSATFLDEVSARLRRQYPRIQIRPLVADFAAGTALPLALPGPRLTAFLGSTIGNLEDRDAIRLLRRLREGMKAEDRLLLGADLVKDCAVIEAAYNDTPGVTAEFSRNVLVVLNRELGADFDPLAFAHQAFFDAKAGRIEMHLVATGDQRVHIPGVGTIVVPSGESIRTEISNKYAPARLGDILSEAGLEVVIGETDDSGGYALLLTGRRD
jgi:L-histidine N-alpha-methyltransferase